MNDQQPKITRVDLFDGKRGVLVKKYEDGWTASTPPAEMHVNAGETLENMVAWFRGHGWVVHTWPGGARAWLGRPMPIRSHWEIKDKRRELNNILLLNQGHHPLGIQIHAVDLAYDL